MSTVILAETRFLCLCGSVCWASISWWRCSLFLLSCSRSILSFKYHATALLSLSRFDQCFIKRLMEFSSSVWMKLAVTSLLISRSSVAIGPRFAPDLGHESSSSCKNSGPFFQDWQLRNSLAVRPQDTWSAGFVFVFTYSHCPTSDISRIVLTLFTPKSTATSSPVSVLTMRSQASPTTSGSGSSPLARENSS